MRLKIILFIKKLLGPNIWGSFLKFKKNIICITHPVQYSKTKRLLLKNLTNRTVFLIGTPQHGNVGDQAIVHASLEFIKNHCTNPVYEIPITQYDLYKPLLKRYCKAHTFYLHGGGNMGIDYFTNEQVRRDIIVSFPKNKLVIFPQTIDYGTTEKGLMELENSKRIYNAHPDLTIFAREKYSYEFMKEHYPNVTIHFVPDIVLSWNPDLPVEKRTGALFCLRHDKESIFSKSDREQLFDQVKKLIPDTQLSDTWAAQTVTSGFRQDYILDKLKEFNQAQLVITDRLHGMIFAAITKTPCIVFANYNHKVEYEYEWIKECPYITFLKDSSLFDATLKEYVNAEYPSFDLNYLSKKFQPLYNILKADN